MRNIFIIAVLLATMHGGAFGDLEKVCFPKNNTCTHCAEYTCDTGYYGTATATTNNCEACPQHRTAALTKIYGTSVRGSTARTDCYLPDGTTGYDATGRWVVDTGGLLGTIGKPIGCYWSED
ncbi:MAG: hypothetical protein K2I81_01845 [Alphaproteobacteria bacterium]|nr:hypothetical protein [Alphaproteobacteria bacterium]